MKENYYAHDALAFSKICLSEDILPEYIYSLLYLEMNFNAIFISNILGFEEMDILCPQRTCSKVHLLQPIKNGTRYYVVLNVACDEWGQKITVRSPLQVNLNTIPFE
jgi:hypothetical protein